MTAKTKKISLDRPFNPYRECISANSIALAKDVLHQLQSYEDHRGLRGKKRKQNDQERFERQVFAIVADVSHRYLTQKDGWVAIPLSKQILGNTKDQFRSDLLSSTLRDVVKRLASPEMAFLELILGSNKEHRQSTIKAGSRLITRIEEKALNAKIDFGLSKEVDPIELRKAKTLRGKAARLKFTETEDTKRLRQEVEAINAWLEQADITYQGNDPLVDDSARKLKRIFSNGSFEQGGRLYGGFWQLLKKQERRYITIDDEWVTYLDFGQMAVRIAYAECGAVPDFDDGYDIPGLSGSRDAKKKLVNILLNHTRPLKKAPAGIRKVSDPRAKYSDQTYTLEHAIGQVQQFHRPINQMFFKDNSLRFMKIESNIMVDVLLSLIQQGITALPIHDGLLCKGSDKELAIAAMSEASSKALGFAVPVDINDFAG